MAMKYPVTPDGRYFVVRERLWRCTDPKLSDQTRKELVKRLMTARSSVKVALRAEDRVALLAARSDVQSVKIALGERGPPWWADDAPDYNRYLVHNTPYAAWFLQIDQIVCLISRE